MLTLGVEVRKEKNREMYMLIKYHRVSYYHFSVLLNFIGRGTFGIKQAFDLTDIEEIPWAARYMKCDHNINDICKDHHYIARCWDQNRTDITPVTRQEKFPKGRAKWHPGSRKHQVAGRVLAFTLLVALKEGLKEWNEADGYNIADDAWHVTRWYENIRTKLEEKGPDFGWCKEQEMHELGWVCKHRYSIYPFQICSCSEFVLNYFKVK